MCRRSSRALVRWPRRRRSAPGLPVPAPADADEARVVESLRVHGWHAFHVRDEFHPDHPRATSEPWLERATGEGFSYTVGLWPLLGHPELVLTGNWGAMERMHGILGAAVGRVREAGRRFAAGDADDDVLEGYPVRFGPVARPFRLELLTWSHWAAHRKDFEALQLLLCDRERRWPGEPGYAGPVQPRLDAAA